MNSISVLQTAASLDSETVFRRMLENGLSTSTEALLDWEAFEPEYFGIETPRHSKIFAKKIILPFYALLSADVQEATLEKIAKQIETDHALFIAYETSASAGIISVYIASHKVDSETLIELLDDEDDGLDFPPAQEDDEDEHLTDPEILIGSDVLVNGEFRGVLEIREDDETNEFFAVLDDESEVEVAGIYLDPEGRYVYGEDLDDDDDIDPSFEESLLPQSDSDDEDDKDDEDDEDDSFEDEQPSNQNPESPENPESDESEFEVESANADVLVPQIRENEQQGDDDFPEEALVETEPAKPEVTEDEALAQAVAEEQAAQQEQPIDWTRPAIEPVNESKADNSDDSTFAEEPQGEAPKAAENAAAAPVEASAEDEGFRVIDSERVSVAEFDRRVNLLEDIRAQLPNDSISEIDDGILSVIIVKDEAEYELSVKVNQQMFAGQKLIDIFQLSSKDNAVARRATNIPAIIDVINSL